MGALAPPPMTCSSKNPTSNRIKIIQFDLIAPVKTKALLLPVEFTFPHFISYNEYLEPICKKTDFNVYKSSQADVG